MRPSSPSPPRRKLLSPPPPRRTSPPPILPPAVMLDGATSTAPPASLHVDGSPPLPRPPPHRAMSASFASTPIGSGNNDRQNQHAPLPQLTPLFLAGTQKSASLNNLAVSPRGLKSALRTPSPRATHPNDFIDVQKLPARSRKAQLTELAQREASPPDGGGGSVMARSTSATHSRVHFDAVTLLLSHAQEGDLPALLALLADHPEMRILQLERNGITPLHYAAGGGHAPLVRYLLETARVSATVADPHGWTPLHAAAAGISGTTQSPKLTGGEMVRKRVDRTRDEFLEVARLLLAHGARCDVRDDADERPADVTDDADMTTLLTPPPNAP